MASLAPALGSGGRFFITPLQEGGTAWHLGGDLEVLAFPHPSLFYNNSMTSRSCFGGSASSVLRTEHTLMFKLKDLNVQLLVLEILPSGLHSGMAGSQPGGFPCHQGHLGHLKGRRQGVISLGQGNTSAQANSTCEEQPGKSDHFR